MIKMGYFYLFLALSVMSRSFCMDDVAVKRLPKDRYQRDLVAYGLGVTLSCDLQRNIAHGIINEVNPCLLQQKHKDVDKSSKKTDSFLWGVYSPDQSEIIQIRENVPRICNIKSGRVQNLCGHTQSVLAVAYNADGSHVVTGALDGKAMVWNCKTGKCIASFSHQGLVSGVDFSKDGKKILTNSAHGTRVIKIHSNKVPGLSDMVLACGSTNSKSVEAFIALCPQLRSGVGASHNKNDSSHEDLFKYSVLSQENISPDILTQIKLSRGLCKIEAYQWFVIKMLPQHAALIYLAYKQTNKRQLLQLKAGSHNHDVWENIPWQAREVLKKIGISVNITKSRRKLLVIS
jgi:hypothetical protein